MNEPSCVLIVLGDPIAATAENGERWAKEATAPIAEILVAMYNFEPQMLREGAWRAKRRDASDRPEAA